VADALSLSPELLDAIRDEFHACHPLSGAIGITLSGRQLNMRALVGASGCRIIPGLGRVISARTPRSHGMRAQRAPHPRISRRTDLQSI
jgi:hypothetical protein